ncbi:hypothetical protein FVR03_03640 [Pontibacter qinzhouensis]|uniref:Uncharacterized protein n=1 Tax=Pontibacter qinzhouensis TaxID=2603253 RepID=A0A5C8KA11_9BACT|nr:hypothetical protein [Pontibacter qinzhouensis]TXK51314.1 hypothetical protein FVR03_03640 [Pontibacter qinzhouensis]
MLFPPLKTALSRKGFRSQQFLASAGKSKICYLKFSRIWHPLKSVVAMRAVTPVYPWRKISYFALEGCFYLNNWQLAGCFEE